MSILLSILIGAVVGGVGRSVMYGPEPLGRTGAILLGISGGVAGGIFGIFFGTGTLAISTLSLLAAAVGSLSLMFLYRAFALRWER